MVINNESSDLAWLDSPVIRMGFQRSLSSTNSSSISLRAKLPREIHVENVFEIVRFSPLPLPPFPLLNNQKLERTNPLKESSRYNIVFFSFSLLFFLSLSLSIAIMRSNILDFSIFISHRNNVIAIYELFFQEAK